MVQMGVLFSVFLTIATLSPLCGYESSPLYRDNTAAYISKITRQLSTQYANNKNAQMIQEKTIIITPTVSIKDYKTTLPIMQHIDEDLIYEMNQHNFKVVDTHSLRTLGVTNIQAEYLLVSTYTTYKYEMVINSRIIERESGVVIASAQVIVPRKVFKDVERLYNKNSWFAPKED